jgi:hypothetical protein
MDPPNVRPGDEAQSEIAAFTAIGMPDYKGRTLGDLDGTHVFRVLRSEERQLALIDALDQYECGPEMVDWITEIFLLIRDHWNATVRSPVSLGRIMYLLGRIDGIIEVGEPSVPRWAEYEAAIEAQSPELLRDAVEAIAHDILAIIASTHKQ